MVPIRHIQESMDTAISEFCKSPNLLIISFNASRRIPDSMSNLFDDLKFPRNKPVYFYDYANLTDTKSTLQNNFDHTDIILVVGKINGENFLIQQLQLFPNTFMIILSEEQLYYAGLNPISMQIIIKKYSIFEIRTSVSDHCGMIQGVEGRRGYFDTPTTFTTEAIYYTPVEPKQCIIGLSISSHHILLENITTQLNFVNKHYVLKLFKTIGKKINANIVIGSNSADYGSYFIGNDDIDVAIANINNFVFDCDNNIMNFYHYRKIQSDLLAFITTDEIVWLVLNPGHEMFNALAISLSLVIFMILLGISLLDNCINRNEFIRSSGGVGKVLLNGWSILLSVSVTEPNHKIKRLVYIYWVLTSACLTYCFYYKIFAYLTSPTERGFRDQEELFESKTALLVISVKYADIAFIKFKENNHPAYDAYIPTYGEVFQQNQSFLDFVDSKLDGTPLAILLNFELSRMLLEKYPGINHYYIPQRVAVLPLYVETRYSNPLSMEIIKHIKYLRNAGLVEKMIADSRRHGFTNNMDARQLKAHFANVYVIIAMLYGFTIIVFLCEILHFNMMHMWYRRERR